MSDIYSFGNFMLGALTNPTYRGNIDLAYANIALTRDLNSSFANIPFQLSPINQQIIDNASLMQPYPFGLEMGATLMDPTYHSDGILRDFNIGLSKDYFDPYIPSIDFSKVGTFTISAPKFGNTPINLSTNTSNVTNVIEQSSINVKKENLYSSKEDKAIFDKKIILIEKYGKMQNTSFDEKIKEIKDEVKTDYKKGTEKLDELIKTLDKDNLYSVSKELYKEFNNEKLTNASTISSSWADKISNQTDGDTSVNTSSLNFSNVLDVVGTFITNSKVKAGSASFKDLMSNKDNFDKISKFLYEKANDLKTLNIPRLNTEIDQAVNDLKSSNDANKVSNSYKLFDRLRYWQKNYNDCNAQSITGVSKEALNGKIINEGSNTYYEEKDAYSKQCQINTKG